MKGLCDTKGLYEILASCLAGLLLMVAYFGPRRTVGILERIQDVDEPVVRSGGDPADSADGGDFRALQQLHAKEAWRHSSGSKNVVVAVIDTGCDIYHPDLASNIWRNPGESGPDEFGGDKSNNGIDDDGNGLVDDVHGWNFIENSNDVTDDHGHGTHIAGIIGADGLDGLGPSGIAPHVSLMILKYYDTENSGYANLRNTIYAIRYAVRMGADIINYSGGGATRNQDEEQALRWAASHGVLVVAAAGNGGLNSDFDHFYPADYSLPNILSVAAVDGHDNLLVQSNFGTQTVSIAAPGKNIYSTLPNGLYGYMTGTSQATAFASGVAALLIASRPDFRDDPQAVIHHLIAHSSQRSGLVGKVRSGGLLDAGLALSDSGFNLGLAN